VSHAAVRRRCKRDAPRREVESGRAQRTPACGKGLVFSPESFLQDQLVERQFGHRPLEPAVLLLQFLEALGLVELQTAALGPPVVGLVRDPKPPGRQRSQPVPEPAESQLLEENDDLLRRITLPCHSLISSIEVGNSRIRSLRLVSLQGSRPPAHQHQPAIRNRRDEGQAKQALSKMSRARSPADLSNNL
jgi:hypothetical protein